jgi:hypothetical protein
MRWAASLFEHDSSRAHFFELVTGIIWLTDETRSDENEGVRDRNTEIAPLCRPDTRISSSPSFKVSQHRGIEYHRASSGGGKHPKVAMYQITHRMPCCLRSGRAKVSIPSQPYLSTVCTLARCDEGGREYARRSQEREESGVRMRPVACTLCAGRSEIVAVAIHLLDLVCRCGRVIASAVSRGSASSGRSSDKEVVLPILLGVTATIV